MPVRLRLPRRSRANAADRLPVDPPGRIEGADGIVEGRHVANVRPQPSIPHSTSDLTQLSAIGEDHEVDRQAVGPRLGRAGDGHQRASDAADIFEDVVPEVATYS